MAELVYHFDPPADGPVNMAADERLADGLAADSAAVRWYSWASPTVSLGAFQRHEDWRSASCLSGLPVVRRPSGGGAILHGSDLTYAIAVGRAHPAAASAALLYDAVHEAARAVLLEVGLATDRVAAGGEAHASRLLCFHRRSAGDLVANDHKVLGSAQRRLRQAVLQHGSLLLTSATALVGHWPADWPELIGAEEIFGGRIDVVGLAESWSKKVASLLALEPVAGTCRPDRSGPSEAVVSRFASEAWTRRR